MGAEDGDVWPETVRSGAVNLVGVARPSGRWGRGGQGVRLSFAAHALLWRYEAIYHSEIVRYARRDGAALVTTSV
jgi:hypothetical protein